MTTLRDTAIDFDATGTPILFDLGRLDLTPANMVTFLAKLTADDLSSTEDNSDLYHAISVIFDYISADMLDNVYNSDDPDNEPEIRDQLDQLTTELHEHLSTLTTFSHIDTTMLTK